MKKPIATILLLFSNIIVFILSFSLLFLTPDWNFEYEGVCTRFIEKFCFIPSKIFERPYSLITSSFLHADVTHLFFNMFALLLFGSFLERKIGRKKFLIVYLLSVISGSVAYFLISPNSNVPALGASGGVFGIVGSLAILHPNLIVYVGFTPMPILFAAILWGIISFLGLFTPSVIAHHAHLGGLLTGILMGIILRKRGKKIYKVYYF